MRLLMDAQHGHPLNTVDGYVVAGLLVLAAVIMLGSLWVAYLTGVFTDEDPEE